MVEPLIHWRVQLRRSTRDEDWASLTSLKERMTRAAEPAERAVSSCPSNTWLEGLRTSFDPEAGKQAKPEPSSKRKAGLIAGRLRSV
jgi:hypothetical protein